MSQKNWEDTNRCERKTQIWIKKIQSWGDWEDLKDGWQNLERTDNEILKVKFSNEI